MTQGWISLHRKIQSNFLWKENRTFSKAEAWIDILMEVNHSEVEVPVMIKNTIIHCGQGQSIKSLTTWATRWNWSKSAVGRFLKLLQNQNMIRTESVTKSTRLTVCNYKTYQEKRTDTEPQVKRKRTASEPQVKPNNKDNKDNNENKKQKADFPEKLNTPEFHKAWAEWTQHRVEIKKKLTPTTISRQLKTLGSLSVPDAIATIDKSIEKGWTGLFPDKAEPTAPSESGITWISDAELDKMDQSIFESGTKGLGDHDKYRTKKTK